MSDRKAVIKNADMSEEMQQDAIDIAVQALEKFNIEKDIAAFIKKEFDKKYNPTWHCIVGRNFGSYITHETKHFLYFYLGQVAILLFKSGWWLFFKLRSLRVCFHPPPLRILNSNLYLKYVLKASQVAAILRRENMLHRLL